MLHPAEIRLLFAARRAAAYALVLAGPLLVGAWLLLLVLGDGDQAAQAGAIADSSDRDEPPYQATGFKVGEVTPHTAIVWTRLTLRPRRNPSDGPRVTIRYLEGDASTSRRDQTVAAVDMEHGVTVGDLREAVPGVDGEVRVRYRARDGDSWQATPWQSVAPLGDFTRQVPLEGLSPATTYDLEVQSRGIDGRAGATLTGHFRTAPAPDDACRVSFGVSTGQGNDDQDCPEGFRMYPALRKLDVDFFVHTGDIVYYDQLAKTVDLARYHWQRTYSWPTNVDFHRHVASYFMKDDHDTWVNDCWPTMQTAYMHEFTFRQGQEIFVEQVPMGSSTYRQCRWGRDLEVWLVEGRDFRSANNAPDGPEKTIWGAEQKDWLKRTLAASDATFRVLISPTPLVGPDRANKRDNHANAAFRHEGQELRTFLAEQPGVVVICGDRHWQYFSVDPATGLREYSCGPASDPHAGGWQEDDFRPEYHRFLRVAGGFLTVTAERVDGQARLVLRFHDVDGKVEFEDVLSRS